MKDPLHWCCTFFGVLPILFIWYCSNHWPNVWLATIIPSFAWAMSITMALYSVLAALVFVIWLVTVGWTRR